MSASKEKSRKGLDLDIFRYYAHVRAVLEKELRFFESKKEEWLEKYRDKYVLIKGEELIDVFTSREDAHKEGVRRYGNQPFFIKQVRRGLDPEIIPFYNDYGVPFPDEEINSYLGKIVTQDQIAEISKIIRERYPNHHPSLGGIEIDANNFVCLKGKLTMIGSGGRVLLTEVLDHGLRNGEGKLVEPPIAIKKAMEQKRAKPSNKRVHKN